MRRRTAAVMVLAILLLVGGCTWGRKAMMKGMMSDNSGMSCQPEMMGQ